MNELNLDDFAPTVYWDEEGNLHVKNPMFPMTIDKAMERIKELERDNAALKEQAELDKANMDAGIRELRYWVKATGFTWCEDENAVFNVTTAIQWLYGALVETQHKNGEREAAHDNA